LPKVFFVNITSIILFAENSIRLSKRSSTEANKSSTSTPPAKVSRKGKEAYNRYRKK